MVVVVVVVIVIRSGSCRSRSSGHNIQLDDGWLVGELISFGHDNLFSKLVMILGNHLDKLDSLPTY